MHDHRKLGRELGLFDTDALIGAGLPYWLPAGAAVRHALEEYLREQERRAGYQHVYSPVLGKRELYELSGHWSHYRDGMYPAMELGGEQVVLRHTGTDGLIDELVVMIRPLSAALALAEAMKAQLETWVRRPGGG